MRGLGTSPNLSSGAYARPVTETWAGGNPLFLRARDGTRLACWDFGAVTAAAGGADVVSLLMLHGAGMHGLCWAPIARALAAQALRPLALDIRGHGSSERSPGGRYELQLLAADVLAVVDQTGPPGSRLIGVGQSLGASALLLAEAARPGTFSRIWAWEPIVGGQENASRRARGTELARQACRRRARFASLDEARSHFQGRGMFSELPPSALESFLSGAFVPSAEGGITLACRPEDEARIYEMAAGNDTSERLAEVTCPVRALGGQLSQAVPPSELARIAAQLPFGEHVIMAGLGHFGPFQKPAMAAEDIANWATTGRPR